MKGKIKTVLAVLALPAIWALGAKTGKGKLLRWWLVLSLYYSPVEIVKQSFESPTVKPVAQLDSQSSGEKYFYSFQSQLRSGDLAGSEVARSYFAAMSNYPDSHWGDYFKGACQDLKEYSGDAQRIGEVAYRVNSEVGSSNTLDQYIRFNQIKFQAATDAGCTP